MVQLEKQKQISRLSADRNKRQAYEINARVTEKYKMWDLLWVYDSKIIPINQKFANIYLYKQIIKNQ